MKIKRNISLKLFIFGNSFRRILLKDDQYWTDVYTTNIQKNYNTTYVWNKFENGDLPNKFIFDSYSVCVFLNECIKKKLYLEGNIF